MAKLAQYVSFKTPGFSSEPREDHINRQCAAEEFARRFHSELGRAIPNVNVDFYQEDFGWVLDIPISLRSDVITITVVYYASEDNTPGSTCLCFDDRISGLRETFNPSLKRQAAAMVDEVIMKSAEILRSAEGIENVQWWQDGPMAGDPMPNPWTRLESTS